ncbi:MAG: BMP family protein [Anaerolineaceae bacterium]|nr:BMP family protein [Anaerolineaceae bacterium]
MFKKLFVLISMLVVLSLVGAACAPAATPEPPPPPPPAPAVEEPAPAPVQEVLEPVKVYKMAVIFPGVITDADYNTLGYIGMTSVQSDLGIETAYSEGVPVPDVDRVMREYIDGGFNIIFTHGGQYLSQTIELAKTFEDVVFIGEGDGPVENPPANFWIIDRRFHVPFYAIGALAAKATQNGKIAYIGGLKLPFSYSEVHAMEQAIADLGVDVKLKPAWVGNFNDPTAARALTETLIAEGNDVIIGSLNLGMLGVFEAAKASPTKVLVTAKYTDKTLFAPDHYITSALYDWAGPLKDIVKRVQAGETGGYFPMTFETGVAIQTPLRNVTPELQAEMDAILSDLLSGKIEVKKDVTAIE